MRAHFAGIPTTPDSDIVEPEPEPLENRIMEFKQDPENMEVLSEFIDDVLKKAEEEANKQSPDQTLEKSQQQKDKNRQSFGMPDFKNGKVVNRARGFVVRLFDAICNCANTAVAAPTQRFKLRTKRQSSSASGTEETNKESKATKNSSGKGKSKDNEDSSKNKVKIAVVSNDSIEVLE